MYRRPRRWLRAGRAVFNAAAELCAARPVGHCSPVMPKTGDTCCGECYEHIVATINNPVNKRRDTSQWNRWRVKADELPKRKYNF
jgi:hypothetical protein